MTALSVLDLAPVGAADPAERALAATTALALRAEELGCTRFWVAEHHGMPAIASSTPRVLIAALAARTSTIRVGSGAVLLSRQAPHPVAEDFGMLAALFPGRIDLGLGRGAGAAPGPAAGAPHTDSFEGALDTVAALVGGGGPDLPAVVPSAQVPAQVWLVGSSAASAVVAAERGLPYAFAHHFFHPTDAVTALQTYRRHFRPGPVLAAPYAVVTVYTVCAEDDARARALAAPALATALGVGGLGPADPFPDPGIAAGLAWTPRQRSDADAVLGRQAVGSPETVAEQLTGIATRTGADEIMLTSNVTDGRERRRSLERAVTAASALVSAAVPYRAGTR